MVNTLLFVGFAVTREKKEKWESGDGRGNNRDKGSNEQDPRTIAGDAVSCVMDESRPGGRDLLVMNCGTIFRTPTYCTASLTTSI